MQLKRYLHGIQKERRKLSSTLEESDYQDLEIKLEEIEEKRKNLETSKKEELILKCLIKGYFMNIAKYSSDNFFVTLV